ncbi:MAG TPA: hypothetical protein VFG04_14130 [Planctomycetaceae bacterium]|jgi:hypothetical protein|nr:hypothetical protein [Planctomycetaceae bacterium]
MPFKPHVKTTVPTSETVIWHYLDLAKFVSMLEDNALWFSSIAVLAQTDQWEGVFHRKLREMWREQTGGGTNDLDHSSQHVRERAFITCWHINENESDAMWKLYSKGGNDLVIRSTFGKLCESFSACAETIYAGEVEYIDHADYDYKAKMLDVAPGSKILNITPVVLFKRLSYAHERELRAFYYTESPARGPDTPGMPMFVDLKALFSEIRVSPRSDDWLLDLVTKIMARYEFEVPVKRSSMKDEPEL